MYNLIAKLFQWNSQQALSQIRSIYETQGFCVVSYVYGAVIVRNKLLQPILPSNSTSWQKALFASDVVLPDGAALRTRRRVAHWLGKISGVKHLSNLNGTDFFPYLLDEYLKVWPINLVCYAVYDEGLWLKKGFLLEKAGEYLQQQYWVGWTYTQETRYGNDDMSDWNWDAMSQACNPTYPTIMMVCRGVPRQELWSYHHRNKLKEHHIIACNQWGTLDYWAGREHRAPWLIRKLRLESLWRVAINPRKNWSKFWVSFQMMWEIVKIVVKK